jgi:hypothetical protein
MSELGIREQLVGCWRLVGYSVTAAEGGETDRPLGNSPLGTILNTPDGYMSARLSGPGPSEDDQESDAYYIAYSGPYDVDEQTRTVVRQVQGVSDPELARHHADPAGAGPRNRARSCCPPLNRAPAAA